MNGRERFVRSPVLAVACAFWLVGVAWVFLPGPCRAAARGASNKPFQEQPLGSNTGYFPGRSYRLGSTVANLGGFLVAEGSRPEGEQTELSVDDLTFLLWVEATPKLRLFSEIQVNNLFLAADDAKTISSDPGLQVNRIYGDLDLGDRLSIRVGKFLTPIGRWNPVLAEPFVWTTSEPRIADLAFDDTTTGAMVGGAAFSENGTFHYSIYGQFLDPSKPDSEPPHASRSVGTRVEYMSLLGGWSVGGSFLAVEKDGLWHYLGGLDGLLQHGPLEITGELLVEDGKLEERRLWGAYVQGVYELVTGFHLIARLEHFDRTNGGVPLNPVDAGVAWFPKANLLLKADYLLTDHRTDDVAPGIRASVSLLF